MLITPTQEQLKKMRLFGMAKALQEQLNTTVCEEMHFEERLGLLVDREQVERENTRLASRLRQAKLRQRACIEDIKYDSSRKLDKKTIMQLSTCQWIQQKQNVIISGPCGAGKSYLACALAHRACMEGHNTKYYRFSRLFQELGVARGDGRYEKMMRAIAKTHVLVIDDWGLSVLTNQERLDLLEIIDDRHDLHSTIISTQVPIEHWHKLIGDPTLADAILDRLVHNAYKIEIKGGSMRKKKSKKEVMMKQ